MRQHAAHVVGTGLWRRPRSAASPTESAWPCSRAFELVITRPKRVVEISLLHAARDHDASDVRHVRRHGLRCRIGLLAMNQNSFGSRKYWLRPSRDSRPARGCARSAAAARRRADAPAPPHRRTGLHRPPHERTDRGSPADRAIRPEPPCPLRASGARCRAPSGLWRSAPTRSRHAGSAARPARPARAPRRHAADAGRVRPCGRWRRPSISVFRNRQPHRHAAPWTCTPPRAGSCRRRPRWGRDHRRSAARRARASPARAASAS